jgi:hypothetical protein
VNNTPKIPFPDTDWVLHMPPGYYEPEWTSSQSGYDESQMLEYAEQCVAAARERYARICEFADKSTHPADLADLIRKDQL